MRFAIIDIGSNAVRFQVNELRQNLLGARTKKLEYTRFPLRLGTDVFQQGVIGSRQALRLQRLLGAFATMMDLYEVKAYKACATSAMREASNGHEVCQQIAQHTGIAVEIISGQQEAEYLGLALAPWVQAGNHLHVDVGGGSTELNFYVAGKVVSSSSFKYGSVRNRISPYTNWDVLDQWIRKNIPSGVAPTLLGTGGNMAKLYELASQRYGRQASYSLAQLQQLLAWLEGFSLEERMYNLHLNPDRADVIVPAGHIYLHTMQAAGCPHWHAPDVGLKDGLQIALLQEMKEQLFLQ